MELPMMLLLVILSFNQTNYLFSNVVYIALRFC